jgi:hypothetical protein
VSDYPETTWRGYGSTNTAWLIGGVSCPETAFERIGIGSVNRLYKKGRVIDANGTYTETLVRFGFRARWIILENAALDRAYQQ